VRRLNVAYFLISYDLNTPGKDYARLYQFLVSANAKPLLDSVYAIPWQGDATSLRDTLRAVMDQNDGIVVAAISQQTYASWNAKSVIKF
jgi:hypothetical protein